MSGIKLILFRIVVSIGTWFGFVLVTVDDSEMLSVLLSSPYTDSRSPLSQSTSPVRRLGMHKKVGQNPEAALDPDGSKGYFGPYDMMLSI